jgi:hypothetical protein
MGSVEGEFYVGWSKVRKRFDLLAIRRVYRGKP